MIALGCGSSNKRELGGWKSIKAVISLLQRRHPDVLNYNWDLWSWGPDGLEYGRDMVNLKDDFIGGYYSLEKGKPIRHKYTWNLGMGTALFKKALKNFKEDDSLYEEEKNDFIMDSLLYSQHVPTDLTIGKALNQAKPSQDWDPELGEELSTWKVQSKHFDPESGKILPNKFTKKEIQKIVGRKGIYENWGIEVNKNNGFYELKIPGEMAERYNYLYPQKNSRIDEKVTGRKNDARAITSLSKFDLLKNAEEYNERLKDIKKEFGELDIEKMQEYVDNEKTTVKEIYDATEEGGLYIGFNGDEIEFKISDDLKERLNNQNHPSVYLYFYHALQPMELRDLLSIHSKEDIVQGM